MVLLYRRLDYLGTDDLAERLKELLELLVIQVVAKVLDVDVVELA